MPTEIGSTGRTLLDDLTFPEGPRWHEGRLWFSDMHDHTVVALGEDGKREDIAHVPNRPSGLGWLPDGRLLVVSMTDRKLLRREANGELVEHADLSALAPFHCNDMVVDEQGRAYVGNFGFDLDAGEKPCKTNLLLVHPDGEVVEVASELSFPNGTVITPDGGTLIVGESFGGTLAAFDIQGDGRLANRRVWASIEGAVPDGICLDEAGGIWVASPVSGEVLRVEEGGEVTHRAGVESQAYACMLGGESGRALFVCTAGASRPEDCRKNRDGRIEVFDAPYARAGLP